MRFQVFLSLFLIGFWAVSAPAQAQDQVGVIRVSGQGFVSATPDMATISVGVEVSAKTAAEAMALNSDLMRRVLALLKGYEISPNDVQTTQLSLQPRWNTRNSSTGQPIEITGFIAANVVNIRLRNISALGEILDGLVNSGANNIRSIQFGIQQTAPHVDEARRMAIENAIHKANLYANAAGVTLGPIQLISEGSNRPAPAFRMEAMAMSDAVPVAEGELTLNAEVSIEFGILR